MSGTISLIEKLDAFIRRYHRNKALRGLLLSFATLVSGLLLVALLEHVGRFGVAGRTVLFYAFTLTSIGMLALWVVWPILQWLRVSRGLSYEEAARIVGNHFPEVQDKLLNTLQLQQQVEGAAGSDVTLLAASIEQRTESLRPLPFAKAVDVRPALRALKMALPVAVLGVGLGLWRPAWVTEPTTRLVQHRTEFVEPAPFEFVLLNDDLRVAAGDPFTIEVQTRGNDLPSSVVVETMGGRFRMERVRNHVYRYSLPSVRNSTEFHFLANGWRSSEYVVRPFAMPSLAELRLTATPPRYTGLPPIEQRNQGDLTVPEGTPIQWSIHIQDGDGVLMRIGERQQSIRQAAGNVFATEWVASEDVTYWITPTGPEAKGDSIRHRIHVVRDGRPSIRVSEALDSTSRKLRYFSGSIQDDYGFSRLVFVWNHASSANPSADADPAALDGRGGRIDLDVPEGLRGSFFHTWDMRDLVWGDGDVLECWFEVWDNDGVNGAKMVRSATTRIAAPSQEEIRQEREEAASNIEDNLEAAIQDADELREAMEAMQERLREQGEMTWQDRQAMEQLLEQQQDLQKRLEQMQQENQRKDERANEFDPQEERILEKQNQLQQLMNEVMSEELREIYRQMQELMDEMDPDKIQEQLNDMELNHEAMEKELDRALEQFRQLQWETKMDETIEELKRLAEEQERLAEEADLGLMDSEDLKAKQDSLNNKFDQLRKDLDQLEKDNQELANPNPMMDSNEEEQSIQDAMEEGSEQLEKGKDKKASESQQQAADQMQQLAERMEAMQQQAEEESQGEDMEALRALLENILALSFDEELLMAELKTTQEQDPRYIGHGQTQRNLKDASAMVEDSLFALSMRIPQLASAVNREIGLVNRHMDKALEGFGERQTPEIAMNQQYVMTSFNNLALLLDEALQQMQQQQAEKQPGSGNCEKPGGSGSPSSSPKAGDMKKMQEALGKKLEQMKQQMGNQANQGKAGQRGTGMSKELAQMAAQQAALRKMAQEKAKELNEDGSGQGTEMQKIAQEMEELERDLVNRRVDQATLQRQQDLITRLLEAENAERIRGEKEERTSRSGDDGLKATPPQASDYLRQKMNELELLKTVPAELLPYYRARVNDYFNNLDLDSGGNQPDLNP
ncbi:MAG: DUF4175 family protein [Bacteroidetes bacterium]|nr:DUF4175 family protein [Bacteroidota bacterium]MDA0903695.1 DUF4175 family protein [Bacteroidota bacterium]MDA1242485.1 DUF4175 family protein [Bacteroidota bacterium]